MGRKGIENKKINIVNKIYVQAQKEIARNKKTFALHTCVCDRQVHAFQPYTSYQRIRNKRERRMEMNKEEK